MIGGGPCAYNPEPLADFFDLFYIGEGETVYDELLDTYKKCKQKGSTQKRVSWKWQPGLKEFMCRHFYDAGI